MKINLKMQVYDELDTVLSVSHANGSISLINDGIFFK